MSQEPERLENRQAVKIGTGHCMEFCIFCVAFLS